MLYNCYRWQHFRVYNHVIDSTINIDSFKPSEPATIIDNFLVRSPIDILREQRRTAHGEFELRSADEIRQWWYGRAGCCPRMPSPYLRNNHHCANNSTEVISIYTRIILYSQARYQYSVVQDMMPNALFFAHFFTNVSRWSDLDIWESELARSLTPSSYLTRSVSAQTWCALERKYSK